MTTPTDREETAHGSLDVDELDPDPMRQFRLWFDVAVAAGTAEPEAMSLATATPDGGPSCRMVLLRGFDKRGFAFFTNYGSRKGRELAANPRAALTLYWPNLQRQVRIEGAVEKTSNAESDTYFQARPAGSRLGAWASEQSEVVTDRRALEEAMSRFEKQHPDGEIPRPEHWGGYRVVPEVIEFWQGRANRLHDRLRYRRDAKQPSGWLIERLAP